MGIFEDCRKPLIAMAIICCIIVVINVLMSGFSFSTAGGSFGYSLYCLSCLLILCAITKPTGNTLFYVIIGCGICSIFGAFGGGTYMRR